MNSDLASRYKQIVMRIEFLSRDSKPPVTLIAVSKTQPVEAIKALYALGHRDFGENYVQELVDKASELSPAEYPGIRWHFIGHLQTNKVKAMLPHVHTVHSIDSEKLAIELAKRWPADPRGALGAKLPCFIEVNIDQEPTKAGVLPANVINLTSKITGGLDLQGLMAIPAATDDPVQAANAFRRLRELEVQCRPHTAGKLSMGMSGDYEIAISEGATHVRVGTALFGKR